MISTSGCLETYQPIQEQNIDKLVYPIKRTCELIVLDIIHEFESHLIARIVQDILLEQIESIKLRIKGYNMNDRLENVALDEYINRMNLVFYLIYQSGELSITINRIRTKSYDCKKFLMKYVRLFGNCDPYIDRFIKGNTVRKTTLEFILELKMNYWIEEKFNMYVIEDSKYLRTIARTPMYVNLINHYYVINVVYEWIHNKQVRCYRKLLIN